MKTISDISYSDMGLEAQKLDILLPENASGFDTFVYLHGGGLEGGDKKSGTLSLRETLTEKGTAVVCPNYRMYPSALYPQFVQDAAAAVAWTFGHIKEYGGSGRIFVGGSSAGGYLSMMLCFDKRWLSPYHLSPSDIAGFVHDAGQPTCHYNVLRERGLDTRRLIVDDSAPLYHIDAGKKYPPMLFIVSDNDIPNRYEQTQLVLGTLRSFEYDMSRVSLREMHGGHTEYVDKKDGSGKNILAGIVREFINGIN